MRWCRTLPDLSPSPVSSPFTTLLYKMADGERWCCAGLADVAGVLVISAIPFAAVTALAESDLGQGAPGTQWLVWRLQHAAHGLAVHCRYCYRKLVAPARGGDTADL